LSDASIHFGFLTKYSRNRALVKSAPNDNRTQRCARITAHEKREDKNTGNRERPKYREDDHLERRHAGLHRSMVLRATRVRGTFPEYKTVVMRTCGKIFDERKTCQAS